MNHTAATSRPTPREPSRRWRVGLTLLVIVPIATAVARALRRDWFPVGDDALLYLRVRDVLTHHHPWLGSWTSASLSVGRNVNNPGPVYADLVAPFAHLLAPGPGAAIGVGVVNALTVAAVSATAHRVGGWAYQRWALLATAALTWTMGSQLLFDIWQAHALLLPFLLYLVVLTGIAQGDRACLPVLVPALVGVGSLLVQTHVSYAYVLIVLTPVAVVAGVLAQRRQSPPLTATAAVRAGLRSRTALWTAAVVVVTWFQPVVDQFTGDGTGNLSRLAASAGGGDLTVGSRTAAAIVAAVAVLPPWWSRSGFSTTVPSTPLTGTADAPQLVVAGLPGPVAALVCVLGLLAALGLLWRATRRAGLHLAAAGCLVAAALVVTAVLSLANLTVGPVGLAAHHVRWVWAAAVYVHLAVLVAVTALVVHRARTPRADTVFGAVAVAATVMAVVFNVPYLAHQEGPVADEESIVALRQVVDDLEPLRPVAPVVYETANLRVFEPYSAAVMMYLRHLEIEFRVRDEAMVRQLGPARRADGSEAATLFQLEGSDALLYRGPACRLTIADGVDDATRSTADNVSLALIDAVRAGSITVDRRSIDADGVDLLDRLAAGDVEAAPRIVYEGHLARWFDSGAAQLDPATTDEVARLAGSPVAAFGAVAARVVSTFALYVEPATVCG